MQAGSPRNQADPPRGEPKGRFDVLNDLRAIVFDLDGTLYVSNDLGREINLAASRYVAELKRIDLVGAAALIRATKKMLSAASGVDTTLTMAIIELGGDVRELHRRFSTEIEPERYLKRDERVVELLRLLGESFELAIYTNNNVLLTTRIMKALGVGGMFNHVFTIEDSWRPKPDRPTLDGILQAIGRKPIECLFVGDRYDIDLRLPQQLGCSVFLSTTLADLLSLETFMEENP